MSIHFQTGRNETFSDRCSHFIKYSQNFVFLIQVNGIERILRITSNCHRTKKQIEAELDWILFLANSGVNVCKPIKSKNDMLINTIDLRDDSLHYVIFEKANGKQVTGKEINSELFKLHGKLTGKIHNATKNYSKVNSNSRFDWNENRLFTKDPYTYLPPNVKDNIIPIISCLLNEAMEIPKTKNSYGLIHGDLNYNNFFINKDSLEVFDFDNCCNGYFVNDISKSLYSSIHTYHRSKRTGDRTEFESPKVDMNLEEVWEPFWNGYKSENEIEDIWFEQIPLFFEIIHLKEFIHHYRHKVPYRNDELKKIFEMEEKQIINRDVTVSFDFIKGKAIKRAR
ncbi:MAG: phosphotransferase [Bacteroidales bacterium]|nr:phosphotransferase [Bacteroidales bacterium]